MPNKPVKKKKSRVYELEGFSWHKQGIAIQNPSGGPLPKTWRSAPRDNKKIYWLYNTCLIAKSTTSHGNAKTYKSSYVRTKASTLERLSYKKVPKQCVTRFMMKMVGWWLLIRRVIYQEIGSKWWITNHLCSKKESIILLFFLKNVSDNKWAAMKKHLSEKSPAQPNWAVC